MERWNHWDQKLACRDAQVFGLLLVTLLVLRFGERIDVGLSSTSYLVQGDNVREFPDVLCTSKFEIPSQCVCVVQEIAGALSVIGHEKGSFVIALTFLVNHVENDFDLRWLDKNRL